MVLLEEQIDMAWSFKELHYLKFTKIKNHSVTLTLRT